jgi:chromate transporter
MIPYIGEMAVAKKSWISRQAFKEGVVIAQTIPGATAMQVAAYVGLRIRGVAGAGAAYLGFVLPAFFFMLILSVAYRATHTMPISKSVFLGLQVIVVAIVARATVTFGKTTLKGWQDALLGGAAACYLAYGGNPILGISVGAAVGMVLYRKRPVHEASDRHEGPALQSTTRSMVSVLAIALVGLMLLYFGNHQLWDLSLLMLRIDALAFGGGFASVPLMLHEVVNSRHWMNTQEFMDGIAMGQVTPGPIVITATFIGHQTAGVLGAIVATVSVFLPSFVILTLVVPHFDRLKRNPHFQYAMRGILASFIGLLLAVTYKFALAVAWEPLLIVFAGAAFVALMLKVEVPWVVGAGAILSAILLH